MVGPVAIDAQPRLLVVCLQSLVELRHWVVEHFASRSSTGDAATVQGSAIASVPVALVVLSQLIPSVFD